MNEDTEEMDLKTALSEAHRAAGKLKEKYGQSHQGRLAAIIVTDIEKVQALHKAWDL